MTTLSPGCRPLLISISCTEVAPNCTGTFFAEWPSGSILKSITRLLDRPNTGLPTYTTFVSPPIGDTSIVDRNSHVGTSTTSRRFVLEAPTRMFPYEIDEIIEMLAHPAFSVVTAVIREAHRQLASQELDIPPALAPTRHQRRTARLPRRPWHELCEWARQARRGR